MSFVEFVTHMKVKTLIACHQHAFEAFGGIPKRALYDNMKTVVIECNATGGSVHQFHARFLDYARHCGFVIKLCRPVRQTSILPAASFRFQLAMITLAVQLTLPLAWCVEDFHLQFTRLTTSVSQVALAHNAPCLVHPMKKPDESGFLLNAETSFDKALLSLSKNS